MIFGPVVERLAALLVVAGACSPAPPRDAGSLPASRRAPPASKPAPAPAASTQPAAPTGIRWYRDDPAAALAQAEREHKLVVVDLWAAWCHTCLSMQEFVLTDAKLPQAVTRFVFLSIDTERAENSEFLSHFPTSGWPTFYVLSPKGPRVRGRWLGAASPSQFARFLADAEHAEELAQNGEATRKEPWTSLAEGDTLASEARYAEAAKRYADALARAPADWHRAPDVRVALSSALSRSGNISACVNMAFEPAFESLTPAISAADHASYTLGCAERLPASDPRRRRALERVEKRLVALCEQGADELTPDDRGDACGNLISVREALGSAAGAREAAEIRLRVLEAASRGMPDDVAVMYDPARVDTLLTLGRGDEALRLAEAREATLPDNYTPPYSIARVALKLGRWPLGLAAIERALRLAHGPRRANVYGVQADLLLGAGRERDAIAALEEQLRVLEALPEKQKRSEAERLAKARLEKLRRSAR
jgi:tetratricopeptide (TPR) repeat protein